MYSSKSAHNKNIKEKIIGKILLAHSDKYSEIDVTDIYGFVLCKMVKFFSCC